MAHAASLSIVESIAVKELPPLLRCLIRYLACLGCW
jgi:hypothetical protein